MGIGATLTEQDMSIVVAVTKGGRTAVAADSLYLTGSHRDVSADLAGRSKVRRVGGSLIGLAGWSVYQNIFGHYVAKQRVPALKDEAAIFAFFLKFWKVLREQYPFVKDQPEGADTPFSDLDSSFLIANRWGLFDVHGNLTVWRHKEHCAIGSGALYAFGALHVLYPQLNSAKEIARQAVEAAIRFDDGCGGPIEVLEVS